MNPQDIRVESRHVEIKLRANNLGAALIAIELADDAPDGYRLEKVVIDRKKTGVFRVLRLTYIGRDTAPVHSRKDWDEMMGWVVAAAKEQGVAAYPSRLTRSLRAG